jgi:parallel beta-helix repeat protein
MKAKGIWRACLALMLTLILVGAVILLVGERQTVQAQSGTGTIRVATIGSDAPGCGSQAAPCQTVQYAVDQAAVGDTIFVATGVYTGVHGRLVPLGYPDPPASGVITQVVYISKTVTIGGGYTPTNWTTPYPITQPTTLDAQGQGRVIVIAGAISPILEGLRLTGGDAAGLGGSIWGFSSTGGGGGVYIISATATLSNNWVFSNMAHDGGGAFLRGSAATLSGNTVNSNTVGYYGGGVFLDNSTATLNGNIINANTATGSVLGSGGGVYVFEGTATLNGNIIYSNTVESNGGGIFLNTSPNSTLVGNTVMSNTAGSTGWGGGLWMRYCDGTVLNENSFIANTAGSRGGGLYMDQGYVTLVGNRVVSNTADSGGGLYASGRAVTLTGNSVLSNTALGGGGLYLEYNDATLDGNTVSFNQATLDNGEGGGLFLYDSDPTLNGNIITFNSADRGGGLSAYRSSPVLTNTVVADNIAGKSGSGLHIRLRSLARLWHTTIARNWGGDGSGLYIDFMGASCGVGTVCTVGMTNTILVSHTVGITVATGSTATLASTLWYSNTTDWDGAGTILTGTLNYWGDPRFALDGYHLISGSAAIDRGTSASVAIDVDGDLRDALPDLGADEWVGARMHVYLPMVLK